MRGWFEAAQVDAFACSHTCLPVFRALPISTRAQPAWVLNNGATGMPNFRSDGAGLFTRIGLRPFAGPALARRHGLVQDGVHIDAIAVDSAEKLDKLKGAGMQILPPSAALKADLKKVGDTMLKEWLDKAGPEGKQLVDAFQK